MSASDVIIRPLDIERDAGPLAVMWNESDLQWPSSWSRGVPMTAELVREWDMEERTLIVFVAEVEGEIAGYCSFMPTESDCEAYLELLNVSPRFQKRSIGRRLIQATIDYAVEKGLQRQTLHTWSANFKAVPAYKKTGHFWTPDHWVWMQNFIPGALQMPLAKPFFEHHDWYSAQVRELTQGEDDERWEGLKVFTQRWQADGEALTIWIDREARAPVAIETDALQAAAILEEIEPVAGEQVTLRWRIMNKAHEPLQVFLHALGDKGLSIDHRDAFVVAAGQAVERTAQVSVAEDAPSSKEDGAAPAVRSILRLNGQEVELFAGLRAKKPLSLDTVPNQISVAPGKPAIVTLQLHNEREQAMHVSLMLTPADELSLEWTEKTLELPAQGHVTVPLSLTPREEGVHALHVHVADSEGQLKPLGETIPVFSLGVGGLLAHHAGKSVRVESDELRVTVQSEDGVIKVEHKDSRLTVATLQPYLGPPYYFAGSDKVAYDLKVEQRAARVWVQMGAEAKHYPGLYLHGELELSSGGIASLRYTLRNRGTQEHKL
ncbi:MAG: GNAT family N-acetyltransferase, partial [Anaerolineae bacterium]|nr:GNAT family N-acetyltransferase [Anaerolineae bacterium]